MHDEDRVAVDPAIGDMISECAVVPVDHVLLHVLGNLADRAFTIVRAIQAHA